MRCLLCRADSMDESRNAYFAQMKNRYIIIENVPCCKCSQCGEAVYSASVMERIDEILDGMQGIAGKVILLDYGKNA